MRHAVLLLAVFAAMLSAQEPPRPAPQPPTPPRFRTQANLVRIDVFATRGGVPLQDLTAADFEVYEDNAPQKIDSFEHIVVQPAGPQDTRLEPNSTRESLQLISDPHRRVFVIYLDTEHVDEIASNRMKEPLIQLLTRMLGPDDLVGIMTPKMTAQDIAFARKTQVIEEGLRTNWNWGRRTTIMPDEQEAMYQMCFPPRPGEGGVSALAREMTNRKRELMVLDSLHDLVLYMAAIREGRTAVITVSDGWLLYGPDNSIKNSRANDAPPGAPAPVGVGPRGVLTPVPESNYAAGDEARICARERMELAMLDDGRYFQQIFQEANRANVSFYTIDPRGLAAWDTDMGPDWPLPMLTDQALLRRRVETLEVLAANTDGLALVHSNDLKKEIGRIADDLTSYYLIGYYSTNAKLDGKFRAIKVRVKRAGVDVRARSGYRAATEAEVTAARTVASKPDTAARDAIASAIGKVDRDARAGRAIRGPGEPAVFHRGPSTGNQLQPAAGRTFPRSDRVHLETEAESGEAAWTAALLDRTGRTLPVPVATSERTDLSTGQRWMTADLTLAPLGPGDYVVQLTRAGDWKTLFGIRVTQ